MPRPRRSGYLLIDHTFSPGIDQETAHAAGLPPSCAVGADRKGEFDTRTCCHCNTVVILNPMRTRSRGYCAKCDAYHCDSPACGLECRNFDKMLDYVQRVNGRAEDAGEPARGVPDLGPLYSTLSVPITDKLPTGG